jgi:hypothetical protein
MIFIMIVFMGLVYSDTQKELPNFHHPKAYLYSRSALGLWFSEDAIDGSQGCHKCTSSRRVFSWWGIGSGFLQDGVPDLPFDTRHFDRQTVERFGQLPFAHRKQPILIHCSTGNHVGGLWFAYRVVIEKAPLALALKEGRRIGMQPAMEDMVFQWVTNPSLQAKL